MFITSVTSSLQGITSVNKVADEDFLPAVLEKKKNKGKWILL